jgi:nitric oxide reductase activation protein
MVDSALVAAVLRRVPDLVELAKEVGLDLSKAKRDDLLFLILVDHHIQTRQILDNQTKILNDIHQLLVKLSEDTAVLLRRTEGLPKT